MDAGRLATIPFFAALDEDVLASVAESAFEVEAAEGEQLALEGDFGYALYAIESGTADVSADGRSLGSLGPGDVFGEIAVLASGRRTATVVATTPMRLIALFKRDVWALERRDPAAAARLRELVDEASRAHRLTRALRYGPHGGSDLGLPRLAGHTRRADGPLRRQHDVRGAPDVAAAPSSCSTPAPASATSAEPSSAA